MIAALVAWAMLAAAAPALAQQEPPERVRLHKEWLQQLGYYQGRIDVAETAAFRAARRAFADDAAINADDRSGFHTRLEETARDNAAARLRPCKAATAGRATACRD